MLSLLDESGEGRILIFNKVTQPLLENDALKPIHL